MLDFGGVGGGWVSILLHIFSNSSVTTGSCTTWTHERGEVLVVQSSVLGGGFVKRWVVMETNQPQKSGSKQSGPLGAMSNLVLYGPGR